MSTLQSSVASALRNAGIRFTGGTWLRLKGDDGLDAISVNAQTGGWRDHRTGEHGNFHTLAVKIGFDDGSIIIDAENIQKSKADRQKADKKSVQWAKTQWSRGIPAIKPKRPHGWVQPAWNKHQEQHQDHREAVYDYLMSRGLDPIPLLPLIKIQTRLHPQYKNGEPDNVDAKMLEAGADFAFLIPMYALGTWETYENMVGVQRTFLKFPDDKYSKVQKIGRAMLGKKGTTQITPNGHPVILPEDRVIGTGEGFETVASYVQVMHRPGLVCWDWQGIKAWSENLIIKEQSPVFAFLVDGDKSDTGQRESAAALRRITAQEHGQAVYLLPPDSITPDGKGNRDWNDMLRQAPDDFAAEIVKAWHNSDESLAAAPKPHDEPVLIKHTGPRDADIAQTIADAVELHVAQGIMQGAIQRYHGQYREYLAALACWQGMTHDERKGIKKPKQPPLLINVSTGVGKSHAIRELLRNSNLPLLVLTRTHDLAAEYAAAGAFAYHGRSEPAIAAQQYTVDFVADHDGGFAASDCYKYPLIKITSENNHVPALTACRSCQHGRKFMLDNYDPSSQPYQDAEVWFGKNGVDPDTVTPCLWLSHQMTASHARIVVAPNASFSETLATWQSAEGAIPRLVIVDEIPELTREIAAHSGDMGAAIDHAHRAIKNLRDDETDADAIIADLERAITLFTDVAAWLGQTVSNGILQIPDAIAARTKGLHIDWLPGATARWEKVELRYGHEPFVPLRMAKALIESVSTRTALAEKGLLRIREVTALGQYISKSNPCILLDATPTRSAETLTTVNDGEIIRVITKQRINIIHYDQYLHGRTWKNKNHQRDEMARLLALREQMQAETGNAPNVLTYMPLCELAETKNAADWGYFGRDDIGQDRWKGQDLLIFGGPIVSPTTQAIAYNADLMLMRLAGVKNLPDWKPDVARDQEITVGSKVVTSHAPLPTDPALREWVLEEYGRRMAQAIGRVRGVRASKPINVWIAGGLPLAGLAKHGITVNGYRREKLIDLRDKSHKKAVEKVQQAMAALQAADQDPGYRAINKWLTDHGLPTVQYKTWQSISKLSMGQNNNTYEPIDASLDSLNSLQKVADWQGSDISDVALNTWDAPSVDPEIRVAAEIILQVSPYTDNWRQKQRDG